MKQPRLFVVDDNPEIGELIQEIARPIGLESVIITDSNEFKSQWLENEPDILVLDMVMPDMDGFDLIQWLAQTKCNVPIILISGREELYAKAASKLGRTKGLTILHILSKPFSVVEMETALNEALAISLAKPLTDTEDSLGAKSLRV